MKIIRAQHLGMCFGVRDAIALAKNEAQSQPITILGELVHNATVLDDLRASGVRIEPNLSDVETDTIMISAHGASNVAIDRVRQLGHNVLEATCPLVHHAHNALKKLVAAGFHPVVIGKRDHVEVRGLTEDFAECEVVLSEKDILGLRERPAFGVISQTTQPIEKVRALVEILRKRFPSSAVKFMDTVCRPTKDRQAAAVDLARKSNVVIVIGGANSNNTRELVGTCSRYCEKVFHVQAAKDLRPEWFEGAETVGLTAGTSTPDVTIDAVEKRIRQWSESDEFSSSANSAVWSDAPQLNPRKSYANSCL